MTEEQLSLLTPDERAAWERCEKATAGPWYAGFFADSDGEPVYDAGEVIARIARLIVKSIEAQGELRPFLTITSGLQDDENARTVALTLHGPTNFENTDFIKNARHDLPAALEKIAAQAAEIEELKAKLGQECEHPACACGMCFCMNSVEYWGDICSDCRSNAHQG